MAVIAEQATIPLSPSQINEYCKMKSEGDELLFFFDISDCDLKPSHILGYLSNLKIDFYIEGFDTNFFLEYLSTPFMVGRSNLVPLHANLLTWKTQQRLSFELIKTYDFLYNEVSEDVIYDQMLIIQSLPLFLVESSNISRSEKDRIVGDKKYFNQKFHWVGPNFAHLVAYKEILLQLNATSFYDFSTQTYFRRYFDEYMYGGDKLIQFFIDSPNNLLNEAITRIIE